MKGKLNIAWIFLSNLVYRIIRWITYNKNYLENKITQKRKLFNNLLILNVEFYKREIGNAATWIVIHYWNKAQADPGEICRAGQQNLLHDGIGWISARTYSNVDFNRKMSENARRTGRHHSGAYYQFVLRS